MKILQIIMLIILMIGFFISVFGTYKCTKGYKNEDAEVVSKSKPIAMIGSRVFVIAAILNIIILLIRIL